MHLIKQRPNVLIHLDEEMGLVMEKGRSGKLEYAQSSGGGDRQEQ